MLNKLLTAARHPVQALRWAFPYDYSSPNLSPLPSHIESLFPGIRRVRSWNPRVPHHQRNDACNPLVGLLTWDEATLLYNYALKLAGKEMLEIGCWTGWSTAALALGGARLTVIDPVLAGVAQSANGRNGQDDRDPLDPLLPGRHQAGEICRTALERAGLSGSVTLIGGTSPRCVEELAAQGRSWTAYFIDGDHAGEAPLRDTQACVRTAGDDALILFHDVILDDVARALAWLQDQGWNCGVHHTAWMIGVAWRGSMQPLQHIPDPRVDWDGLLKRKTHLAPFRRI